MSAPKKRGRKKLTPWFDGSVKPARPGVYERDFGQKGDSKLGAEYQYFDGRDWFYGDNQVMSSLDWFERERDVCDSAHDWRGLAERP